MSPSDTPALPPGAVPRSAERSVPPANGSGPLNKGRRGIADVLERAGQKDGADYMRSLDLDRVDQQVQQTVQRLESGVRRKPLVAVVAAVIAGFVIGRMIRD